MLEIQDLHVSIEGNKPIIKGLFLTVKNGEIHAIMGPNGAGKSTLAKVLSGHPDYEITSGRILLNGEDVTELDPEERVHKGLFMSFQYPLEIPGVSNRDFLQASYNAVRKARQQPEAKGVDFDRILEEKMKQMDMRLEFKERNLNEGFSGGEKKRNEILQMSLLEPQVAILDETDSGLDIDAIRIVSKGINQFKSEQNSLILITHYQRLLDYVKPHFVHVMIDGKIVKTGDASLALELEEKGYDWLNTASTVQNLG
ncbi:MAG: ATP-dependent transporter ycf16 [Chlamydiales bacterium]|jgi:Fe-S cluster assembly ATP-binding protein|nr:ATP-dependent transporter ycf16 [Chlamydiales bacterium]